MHKNVKGTLYFRRILHTKIDSYEKIIYLYVNFNDKRYESNCFTKYVLLLLFKNNNIYTEISLFCANIISMNFMIITFIAIVRFL